MDSPPRNHEWIPLATQQLRLRHLNRIIGLNILCSNRCKLYFTLHHKLESVPFYTSAYIQHCGNSEAILWDEISCSEILKSNIKSMWVRVWEQASSQLDIEDKSLFIWRVWFSGLVLTGSTGDAKYFSNTLVFQLSANCFSSPDHFSNFTLENNDYLFDNIHEHTKELRERHDSSSAHETIQSDSSLNSKSRQAESFPDLNGIRCIAAQRLKSSTRQSYNLEKLLRIQKIQRSCKRLKQDLLDITKQITDQNLRFKGNAFRGRAIDYLLSDFDQTNPKAIIESKELRKNIEKLRFKCSILERERDMSNARIKELMNQLHSAKEGRNNRCLALRENHTQLSEDKSMLVKRIKVILNGVRTKKDFDQKIHKRLSLLCSELKHIYPISKNSRGCFTISNIAFPDKDYLSSNSLHTDHVKLMTPAALSVALGFVAHLVQITAIILDKPLRFSLQNKSSIPSKQILYGIYLLNQNIAQLNYDIFELRLDPRATIENFLKLFCNIIKLGEDEIDGDNGLIDDLDRIEDIQDAKSSIDANRLQVERLPIRKPLATEDKRYHSEDDLKTIAQHCLKHSYSHERLEKE